MYQIGFIKFEPLLRGKIKIMIKYKCLQLKRMLNMNVGKNRYLFESYGIVPLMKLIERKTDRHIKVINLKVVFGNIVLAGDESE